MVNLSKIIRIFASLGRTFSLGLHAVIKFHVKRASQVDINIFNNQFFNTVSVMCRYTSMLKSTADIFGHDL